MITKIVATYDFDEAKIVTLEATPAVPEVPAVAVDLAKIPAEFSE